MKRFALKKFVAGDSGLAFMCDELSASLSGDLTYLSAALVHSDMFFANTTGSFVSGNIDTPDHMALADQYLDREYSINNPEIVNGGVDLRMRSPMVPIVDCVQFGNYAFHMTDETISGVSFYLSGAIGGGDVWYTIPHEIVTYLTGTIGFVDQIIQRLSFDYSNEGSEVFGASGSYMYVKSTSSYDLAHTAYATTLCGRVSIPFTYMLEQPLNADAIRIDNTPASAYGALLAPISGYLFCRDATVAHPDVYSDLALLQIDDHVLVNPFNLKNMYDPNWQTPIDRTNNTLRGIRDYIRVGKAQETLWMSYRYYHDAVPPLQDYDMVERVRGFYKYKQTGGHKSNMFAVQINNSGLNTRIKDTSVRKSLQLLVEDAIFSAIKKVAPAHTALLKVNWVGQ